MAKDLTNKPTVGGDRDTWGVELNAALDELDNMKASHSDVYDKSAADARFVRTVNGAPPDVSGNVVASTIDPGALRVTNNLGDVPDVVTARANLGLGTAATSAATAFDASGAAATAQAFSVQRANHTGTQLASTISDLMDVVGAKVVVIENGAAVPGGTPVGSLVVEKQA